MAVLGLILLAAAGVLTAAVVTSNTDSLSVDLWNISVSNVTLGVVFVAGMITTVLAVVGLGMLMAGLRRGRRLRQERRSLRRENKMLAERVDSTEALDGRTSGPDQSATDPGRRARAVVRRARPSVRRALASRWSYPIGGRRACGGGGSPVAAPRPGASGRLRHNPEQQLTERFPLGWAADLAAHPNVMGPTRHGPPARPAPEQSPFPPPPS